jgi:cytochrome c oxidase subunit 3
VDKTVPLQGTGAMEQRKKIHPHKFTLWVAIASILMMFAGLTSAYIVKRSQANFLDFDLPLAFWYSTVVMIASSVTMWLAQKNFINREMASYKKLITVTFILGLLFIALQAVGFWELYKKGLVLQTNVSVSFLYVIVMLHALHVVGGVIALMVMFIKAYRTKIKTYNSIPVEVMATYWHFVDFLWIYLLVFLLAVR